MTTSLRKSRRRGPCAGAALLAVAALVSGCSSSSSTSGDYGSAGKGGYVAGDGVIKEIAPPERGKALRIEGTTYAGDRFSSTSVRGKILVVNVWYAACPPCRAEAPDLQKIYSKYKPQGVHFIGVNTRDDKGPAKAFDETFGITYPSIPDQAGDVTYEMRGDVPPNAVPSTLVLDREGRVAGRINGGIDPSTLRSMIDRVVGEKASR